MSKVGSDAEDRRSGRRKVVRLEQICNLRLDGFHGATLPCHPRVGFPAIPSLDSAVGCTRSDAGANE